MSVTKNGSVSKDFPLFHTNLIPIYLSADKKMHNHKLTKNTFVVTNEHPDFFKLEGMKEAGYRNPYLNEVIKVDRSESYKLIDSSRRQLNLINFINSNRKYSQDPNIIKYITNANINAMNKKREQIIKDKIRIKERNLTQENEDINDRIHSRNKILNNLNKYIPKIDYKMTKTIDYSQPIETESQNQNKLNYSKNEYDIKENNNILKKYNIFFDKNKSSYLKNFNDYKISEAQQRDLEKGLNYQRKPSFKYNLFKNKNDVIVPPPYRVEKWGEFHENFYTIANNRGQFGIKGGLFSEFSDKNKNIISINKSELREKIKKEMEMKSNMKNNKYQNNNNSSKDNNSVI